MRNAWDDDHLSFQWIRPASSIVSNNQCDGYNLQSIVELDSFEFRPAINQSDAGECGKRVGVEGKQ